MIWCKKPHRDTEFRLPKAIHFEKLMDVANTCDYCAKDETHDGVFRCEWGWPAPLILLKKEDFHDWQTQIDNCISFEPDDRTIWWIYSEEGGMGKSAFCKYLAFHRLTRLWRASKMVSSVIRNMRLVTNCLILRTLLFSLIQNLLGRWWAMIGLRFCV